MGKEIGCLGREVKILPLVTVRPPDGFPKQREPRPGISKSRKPLSPKHLGTSDVINEAETEVPD